jgi:hypothetical protein
MIRFIFSWLLVAIMSIAIVQAQCPEVTHIEVSNITATEADVSWYPVNEATSYHVYINGNFKEYEVKEAYVHLTGLTPGVSYTVCVQTICGKESSEKVCIAAFRFCPPVTGLQFKDIVCGENTISWNRALGSSHYAVFLNGKLLGETPNTTYNLPKLTQGLNYSVCVENHCGEQESEPVCLNISACPAVNNLTAVETTEESIQLKWDDVSDANGYLIKVSPGNITLQSNTSTINIGRLQAETSYTVCVIPLCGNGEPIACKGTCISVITLPAGRCPMPVISGTESLSCDKMKFSWESVINAYAYEVSVNGNLVATVNPPQTSLTLSSLVPGANYNICIKSLCKGSSSAQRCTTLMFCPPAVADFLVSDVTNMGATLTWSPVTGAVNYRICFSPGGICHQVTGGVTTLTISDLVPGTAYNVCIATDCGKGIAENCPASCTKFTTRPAYCEPIANLAVIQDFSCNQAKVTWDAVTNAEKYEVFLNSVLIETVLAPEHSCLLNGLVVNNTYEVCIRLVCNNGESRRQCLQFRFCPAVSNIQVNAGISQATITWNSITGATRYDLWLNPGGFLASVTGTTHTFTGLSSNTDYNICILAQCSIGSRCEPVCQSFRTLRIERCPTVLELKISNIKETEADVSWKTMEGATSYQVYVNGTFQVYETQTPNVHLTRLTAGTEYTVCVVTKCGEMISDRVCTNFRYCAPVKELKIIGISCGTATLQWLRNPAASHYAIYLDERFLGESITNSFALTTLTPGKLHNICVESYCSQQKSERNCLSFVACPTIEGLVTEEITENSSVLKWQAIDGVLGYRVVVNPGNIVKEVPEPFIVLENLTPETNYTACVSPYCKDNQEDGCKFETCNKWITLPPSKCPSVTNLQFTPKGCKEGLLTWTSTALATGYVVSVNGTLFNVPANTTSYNINELIAGNTYEFCVRALCNLQLSSSRCTSLVFCSPQITVDVQDITHNSATVSWSTISGASGYSISLNGTTIATVAGNITSYLLTNLQPLVAYSVCVYAQCGTGIQCPLSECKKFRTPQVRCNAISDLQLISEGCNKGLLTWNGTTSATGYTVSVNGSALSLPASVTSYSVNDLIPGNTYEFCVQAICYSQQATPVCTAMVFCPPQLLLNVQEVTTNTATVSWNPISGVSNYYITLNGNSIGSVPGNINSYTVTNLEYGITYNVCVTADCGVNSRCPLTACTKVETLPNPTCPAIMEFAVTSNYSCTKATVNWYPINDPTVTGYEFTINGSTPPQFIPTGVNTYELSGLNPNQEHVVCIRTICKNNNTVIYGTWICDTFKLCATIDPNNIQISATDVTATISWNAISNSVGYSFWLTNVSNQVVAVIPAYYQGTSYTFTNLQPNSTYTFGIVSYCDSATRCGPVTKTFSTSSTSSCPAINGLTIVSNYSCTKATVSWNSISNPFFSGYELIINGSTPPINISSGVTSYELTGLDPNLEHVVCVRTRCRFLTGAIVYGAWICDTFKLCAMIDPNDIQISATDVTATVSWNAISNSVGYSFWLTDANNQVIASSPPYYPNTSYTFTNLQPNSNYTFRIVSYCDSATRCGPVTKSFTTSPNSLDNPASIQNNVRLYPNPTDGQYVIDFGSQITGEIVLEGYNSSGSRIYRAIYKPVNQESSILISWDHLPKGIYQLQIIHGAKRLSIPVFLNK